MAVLEDQDTWWLSGIHRHVRLLSKPAKLAVRDFAVTTDVADGGATALGVRVSLPGAASTATACARSTGPHADRRGAAEIRCTSSTQSCSRSPSERVGAAGRVAARRRRGRLPRRCCSGRRSGRRSSQFYTLVIELVDGGGRVVDEASRVGVRSVSIADGLLRVNGVPITVRGVNRHEFSPVGGRTVSWAEAVTDATLMKRHNVNAPPRTTRRARAGTSCATPSASTLSTRRTPSGFQRAAGRRGAGEDAFVDSGLVRSLAWQQRTTRASSCGRSATRRATGWRTTRWQRGRAHMSRRGLRST